VLGARRSEGVSLLTRWSSTSITLLALAAACGEGERGRDDGKQPPASPDAGSAGYSGQIANAEGGRSPDEYGVGGGGEHGDSGGSIPEEFAGAGFGASAGGFDSGGSGSGGAGGEVNGPSRGRVVDFETSRALPGRRVAVGHPLSEGAAEILETDADGYFTFEASGPYQVLIVDPDGSTVSFYERLETPNPVLVHHSTSSRNPPTRTASINGTLSGGAPYPLTGLNDMVVVHLLSDQVTTYDSIGGDLPPHGPDYNLFPGFESEPLPATLLALGIFRDPADDKRYSAALAMTDFTLFEGENAAQDLELTAVALGHVSGAINVPAGWEFEQTSEYYRMPVPNAAIGFPYAPVARVYPGTMGGAFDYELPNLYPAGGQLCIAGMAKSVAKGDAGEGWVWTEKCGIGFESPPVSIDFEEPPTLVEPAANARFTTGTRFIWSRPGSPSAPNLLELYPSSASLESPGVSIFTTSDTATLPDLEALGVKLPVSAAYSAIPIALWSDATDAFGPDGFGAIIPGERRTSYKLETRLVVGP
jgi:hypothetical protein